MRARAMKPKITITDYQVDFAAGTIVFREDAMKVKGRRQPGLPFLRAPYTTGDEEITLRLDELPSDVEVML